jgi:hypothetical protein
MRRKTEKMDEIAIENGTQYPSERIGLNEPSKDRSMHMYRYNKTKGE